jgi:hypothetical protein
MKLRKPYLKIRQRGYSIAINQVQYAFNTMVNAISHHSHPRSIHGQSMVNPWSIHSQRHNNGATTP